MSLKPEQVDHIAELARIELTDEERDRFRKQLSMILEYFQMLNDLDTEDIPTSMEDMNLPQMFRIDELKPGLEREQILRNAPDVDRDQFRVPPVFS